MSAARGEPPALELRLPSPLVELRDERLEAYGVRLLVKRDDLIHPELPGNKWRKLHHNLAAAVAQGHDTLYDRGARGGRARVRGKDRALIAAGASAENAWIDDKPPSPRSRSSRTPTGPAA